jgi:hypothetical protein
MLQNKQPKEEEGKGGRQAELNRPGKGQQVGTGMRRGRRYARPVALAVAALPQALPEAPSERQPSHKSYGEFIGGNVLLKRRMNNILMNRQRLVNRFR